MEPPTGPVASSNAPDLAPKTAAEVGSRPMTLGRTTRSQRKRQAELLFGKRVAPHMGLYHSQEPAAKKSVEEPLELMDADGKRLCCVDAIRGIKDYFGEPYDTASLIFDWSLFQVSSEVKMLVTKITILLRCRTLRVSKLACRKVPCGG